MSIKKWEAARLNREEAVRVATEYGLDTFTALLAVSRGFQSDEELLAFLQDEGDYCDPFDLPDMDKAVARIEKAIDNCEKIAVYGDYDADGVTSTAILYMYLEQRGADVVYYIPERETDGYGLNNPAIQALHEKGVTLIVTVDNGISAREETEFGKTLGVDFVVTDHHEPPELLPEVCAVVDPHRKDCMLDFEEWSGAGVAFKLITALEGCATEELLPVYAPLAAIGTVADVVALKDENRFLVKSGITYIEAGQNCGISALCEAAGLKGKKLTGTSIAFGLAPRINAAGRMGSAVTALKLLLSQNEEECRELAAELDTLNRERQQLEQEIFRQAEEKLAQEPMLKYSPVLVVWGENWHPGVIGIVAARLTEKYGRPCFVLSSDGELSKGSGRSIEGFSLYDALTAVSDCLEAFGGHKLAAGVTIKTRRLPEFRKRLEEYCAALPDEMPFPVLHLDCRINPSSLSVEITESLAELEPFGAGNPQPLFGIYGAVINAVTPVGGGKHLRLTVQKKETVLTVMKFSQTPDSFEYAVGDTVDLAVYLSKNVFAGKENLTIQAKDIRPSGRDDEKLTASVRRYERFVRGGELSAEDIQFCECTRDDFALVYRYLKKCGGWRHSPEMMAHRLNDMDYAKLCIIIDAMQELGLAEKENESIALRPVSAKADLSVSKVLARAAGRS